MTAWNVAAFAGLLVSWSHVQALEPAQGETAIGPTPRLIYDARVALLEQFVIEQGDVVPQGLMAEDSHLLTRGIRVGRLV